MIWLGVASVLFVLVLLRITSVLVAITLVPIAAVSVGGFGADSGVFALDGIRGITPTVVLLAFAVV